VDTIHEEGWIKLHRKSIHSQVFQSEGLWKLWSWCLLRANHEDTWIPITTGRGITEVFVKRGQFIFGRKSASKILKMDESTIYKRMRKLATMGNLNTESNTHYSIVTVLNYELYQGSKNDEVTPKVTPKEHPSNTDKNDKNEKNNNGRSKKQTDPRVREFLNHWTEIFLRETGQPYVFSYGKEGKLIKDLLKVHSFETLKETMRVFFRDEQCKRRGLTIGILRQEVNRLLTLKGLDPLEQARREIYGG